MAVSIPTPNTANLRADFMISDAAMASRNMEAAGQEQQSGSRFEDMLAKAEVKTPDIGGVKEAYDSGKYDVPTLEELEQAGIIYIDKDTGRVLPENPKELAKLILSGKTKLENVPPELISPELLKELMVLKKSGFLEDEDEDEEDFFKPADDAVNVDMSKQIANSELMAELAALMAAAGSDSEQDAAELVEEVLETVIPVADVTEQNPDEIPSIIENHLAVAAELKAEAQDVQTAAENVMPKARETQSSDETEGNFDQFVLSGAEDIPVIANEAAQTADNSDTQSENENAAEAAENVPKLSGAQLEALRRASENDEIGEVEIKPVEAAAVPEKTEEVVVRERESSEDRVSAVNEELEMLKNNVKKPQNTAVPARTEALAADDAPIVLRKDNGEFAVISRNDFVSQVQKAVEAVIAENKQQSEYSLVLNPEELGRITVKMTKAADGAVSVTILAENARTQRILEENGSLMQSHLKDNGVNLESWQTVRESQQDMHAQDYQGSAKNPYQEQQHGKNEEAEEENSFADIIAAM